MNGPDTLPFPPGRPGFVANPIDRAAHLRTQPDQLAALERHPESRVYVVHRDSVLLKHGAGAPRARVTLDEARAAGASEPPFFLGLERGAAVFGMGLNMAAAEGIAGRHDLTLENLRALAMTGGIAENELSRVAMAKSLAGWHQRHGFCANCGKPTLVVHAGWRRDCPSCKAEHFPRTDPVVIMMVTMEDRCLLGRQAHFAPMMWSCLAGFVEAAETIEDAVRREIFEEAHIVCTDVRYFMSQPWPYSSSLMVGCTARALTSDIIVDTTELEDARWFDKTEVAAMLRGDHPQGIVAPQPIAIAHHLLLSWVAGAV
ncbi:MAG: NAD(+) diphosphatase [Bradyrhizobiaceae bacterium]|nr:MAG: NAD(+) diphosphatase [Bradyrhizobiaceae bacterium]